MFIIRDLGTTDYQKTWQEMLDFTANRDDSTLDEIWFLQHYPVYTLGQAGKSEHIFHKGNIPVVQSDRGGQVTYHGPGQLIVYFLLDCKKNQIGVRQLVDGIENLTIDVLAHFGIQAQKKCGAPGVYVNEEKIASLGLRIKNNCSYHGLAINIDMDLKPFTDINPCGYKEMRMTQTTQHNHQADVEAIKHQLTESLFKYIQDGMLFKLKQVDNTCKS